MGRKPKAGAEQSIAAAFAKTAAAKKAVAKPRVAAKPKATSLRVASPELKADKSNRSAGYEKLTPAKRKEYTDASKESFGEALAAFQDESKRQCLDSAFAEVERKVVGDVVQSSMEKSNQWQPGIDVDLQGDSKLGSSTSNAAANVVDPVQTRPVFQTDSEPCALKQAEVPEGAGVQQRDADENQKKYNQEEDCPEAKKVDGDAANAAEVQPADVSASKQCEMPPLEGDESMLSKGSHDESAVVLSAATAVVAASAASTPCHAEAHVLEAGSELGPPSSEPGNLPGPVKPEDADVQMDAAAMASELDHHLRDDDESQKKENQKESKEDCPQGKKVDGHAASAAEVQPADASASKQREMPPSEGDKSMLSKGNHDESAVAPSAGLVKPDADVPMEAAGKASEPDHSPRDEDADENQKKENQEEDCPEAKKVDGDAANAAEVQPADVSASKQCEMPPLEGDESMLSKGSHDESAVVLSAATAVVAASAASTPCHAEAHVLEAGSELGPPSSEPGNLPGPVKPEDADVQMEAAATASEPDHRPRDEDESQKKEKELREDCSEGQAAPDVGGLFGEAGPAAFGGDMDAEPDAGVPNVEDYKAKILQELLEMSDVERRSKIEKADMHEDLHEYNQFLKERGLPEVSFAYEVQTAAGVGACVPLSGFFAWLWEKEHENEKDGDDCGSEGSLTEMIEKEMDKMQGMEGLFARDMF